VISNPAAGVPVMSSLTTLGAYSSAVLPVTVAPATVNVADPTLTGSLNRSPTAPLPGRNPPEISTGGSLSASTTRVATGLSTVSVPTVTRRA
jgi:hypothetical protein